MWRDIWHFHNLTRSHKLILKICFSNDLIHWYQRNNFFFIIFILNSRKIEYITPRNFLSRYTLNSFSQCEISSDFEKKRVLKTSAIQYYSSKSVFQSMTFFYQYQNLGLAVSPHETSLFSKSATFATRTFFLLNSSCEVMILLGT